MKLEYYTKTIRYLYYILFFTLPFIVLPVNSELFEFNKMLFIYTIATFILGVWLLRCIQERRLVFKRTVFDIPLVIFLASQIISTIFSIDQQTSFYGYYGRFNGGLLSTITYIFLYYSFVSNIEVNINKTIRKICGLSIVSSLLVVLWGLPGKFNHDLSCLLFTSKFDNTCWTTQFRPAERMFSTLGQPNWLGAYLAITFFTALFMLFTSHTKKVQLLSFFGLFFSYLGILLSRSRSSILSLMPGAIILGLYLLFLLIKKNSWATPLRTKIIIVATLTLLIITFIVQTGVSQIDTFLSFSFLKKAPTTSQTPVVSPAPQQQPQSLEGFGGVTESFDIRKIVWQGAWELGSQYPLFGTGVETFGYAYYSVRPASHNLTSEWDYLYNKAHNEYLNFLATTGWVGLGSVILLIIWMCVVVLLKVIKNKNDSSSIIYYLALVGIFTSIFITNFFGFSITVINIYWYGAIGFLALYNEPDKAHAKDKPKRPSLSLIGVVILLVLWLLFSIGNYWLADYKYAQSDGALRNNDTGVAINLLQEAIALRDEPIYEDKESYALAQYAYMAAYQKDKEKAKQLMDLAETLNLKSIQSSTQNVLYWKTRVKNEFIFYQMSLDKKYLFTGLAALGEAEKLAPTDPKIPYFSSTYYSLLYDDEKDAKQKELYKKSSLDSINKSIVLKSDYADAYNLKIQLFQKYGNKIEEKKLLEWYIPRFAPDNADLKKQAADL